MLVRSGLFGLCGCWLWLDKRIEAVSEEIAEISHTEEHCANIMTIPGIGPMVSTAMVAAVGKGEAFDQGRDFAAWVGLAPRDSSARAVAPSPDGSQSGGADTCECFSVRRRR
jgi:transposase